LKFILEITKSSFGNFKKYSPTSFYHYMYPIEGCFILQKQIERRKKNGKLSHWKVSQEGRAKAGRSSAR